MSELGKRASQLADEFEDLGVELSDNQTNPEDLALLKACERIAELEQRLEEADAEETATKAELQKAERELAAARKHAETFQHLNAHYRLGKHPSEALLNRLDKATAWMAKRAGARR